MERQCHATEHVRCADIRQDHARAVPWSFPEAPHKRVFNRQDAKYAKFPRRCLSAGENIEFVGLGGLGVLAVGQIVKLQEKTITQSLSARYPPLLAYARTCKDMLERGPSQPDHRYARESPKKGSWKLPPLSNASLEIDRWTIAATRLRATRYAAARDNGLRFGLSPRPPFSSPFS